MRDYAAEFRNAARARGIDPAAGATEYQAALVRADKMTAARSSIDAFTGRRWWDNRDLWQIRRAAWRSGVEVEAIETVRASCSLSLRPIDAGYVMQPFPAGRAEINVIKARITGERRVDMRDAPLRAIHERQAARQIAAFASPLVTVMA